MGGQGSGRPNLPQGQDLIDIVEANPDLSYPAIWRKYGWGGQPTSVRGALNRAGYRRWDRRTMDGGGPMDIMPHEEFWGRVDQTMKDIILPAIKDRVLQRSGEPLKLKRSNTTTKTIGWDIDD